MVLDLVEKGGLLSGFSVTFDNLFTSFPLIDELSKRGIGGLVTIMQNCFENAAVPSKQTKKKMKRLPMTAVQTIV